MIFTPEFVVNVHILPTESAFIPEEVDNIIVDVTILILMGIGNVDLPERTFEIDYTAGINIRNQYCI
jgi:hypothetical protein